MYRIKQHISGQLSRLATRGWLARGRSWNHVCNICCDCREKGGVVGMFSCWFFDVGAQLIGVKKCCGPL